MTHSAIYVGTIRHRRHEPVGHAFRHQVGMLYLDLDELPEVLEHRPLWSASHPAPGRFCRADHLGDPAVPLKEAVALEVERRTGSRPDGPIRLLTAPRTAGRVFNPLSLFYCFARDRPGVVTFVVAEVTNTPWGERHCYVLDARSGGPAGSESSTIALRQTSEKALHVSPFMGMHHRYAWVLTTPGSELGVHIEALVDDGAQQRIFDATLKLDRRELSRSSLRGLLLRYPFQAARTGGYIYAHALALKLKGAPHFPHPDGQRSPRRMATRLARRGTR